MAHLDGIVWLKKMQNLHIFIQMLYPKIIYKPKTRNFSGGKFPQPVMKGME